MGPSVRPLEQAGLTCPLCPPGMRHKGDSSFELARFLFVFPLREAKRKPSSFLGSPKYKEPRMFSALFGDPRINFQVQTCLRCLQPKKGSLLEPFF